MCPTLFLYSVNKHLGLAYPRTNDLTPTKPLVSAFSTQMWRPLFCFYLTLSSFSLTSFLYKKLAEVEGHMTRIYLAKDVKVTVHIVLESWGQAQQLRHCLGSSHPISTFLISAPVLLPLPVSC